MSISLIQLQACNFNSLPEDMQRTIYTEFYKMFYGTIYYMVKDHAATEDVIQESFLRVIHNIPQTDHQDKLKAWLKVVVRNSTINYLRKAKKSRNLVDFDSVFTHESMEYSTIADSIEDEIELKAMVEVINRCLMELKMDYRAMIELRWKRQLSYREIAEELDITERKVKYTLFRAREAIKKRVVKEWGEHHD